MKDSLLLILLNDIEGVKKLIAEGEDINFQDKFNKTALMFASFYNKPEIVKLLIEGGAELDIQDQWGYTALDYAKEGNHTKIIELLTEAKKLKEGKEGKALSPTSKVIQITTTENLRNLITTALCGDGSVWRYAYEKWVCILEAPSNENK
jgi:ankyrin repeat protein